jgi:DNA-binding SARP family transcriptional activator
MSQSINQDTVAALPAALHMRLLGNFSLISGDRPVTGINTPRLQSLFAYLALHRDIPQLRQHLAFLFWPDSREAQARNNLRQLLHVLRSAVPSLDAYLLASNSAIWWRVDAPIQLDVNEFEQTLALAEAAEHRAENRRWQATITRQRGVVWGRKQGVSCHSRAGRQPVSGRSAA